MARYRLKQDGLVVAGAEGERALQEITHYAAVYERDGPVQIEEYTGKRWRKHEPAR